MSTGRTTIAPVASLRRKAAVRQGRTAPNLFQVSDPAVQDKKSGTAVSSSSHPSPAHQRPLIVSSGEFTKDFVPPDYLIDGLIQRRFLYSLTAPTGAGKTAVALLIAAHVALGRTLGNLPLERGRVLYFAGENPDDLRMRWIAMAEHMGFDPDKIDVHFVVGAVTISKMMEKINNEVQVLGGVSLIILDTSAAYFEGEDENDNVLALQHARMIRSLTAFPGGPAVLLLAHPTKKANAKNLLPRGGGALIAEVDGNFVVQNSGTYADLHWQGKFRGADFKPITFELRRISASFLKDSKGRRIPTVIAVPLAEKYGGTVVPLPRNGGKNLLALMKAQPGLSFSEMAEELKWRNKKGEFDKKRVQKTIAELAKAKLVEKDRATNRYKLAEAVPPCQ